MTEWMELVRVSVGVGEIGQVYLRVKGICRRGQDWLEYLQEWDAQLCFCNQCYHHEC